METQKAYSTEMVLVLNNRVSFSWVNEKRNYFKVLRYIKEFLKGPGNQAWLLQSQGKGIFLGEMYTHITGMSQGKAYYNQCSLLSSLLLEIIHQTQYHNSHSYDFSTFLSSITWLLQGNLTSKKYEKKCRFYLCRLYTKKKKYKRSYQWILNEPI